MGRGKDLKPRKRVTNRKCPPSQQDHYFKKGEVANPKGRKYGTRNKLCFGFIIALSDDFEKHGRGVIEKVRVEEPATYIRTIGALVPKEVNLKVDPMEEMTDEQLVNRARELAKYLGVFGGVDRVQQNSVDAKEPEGPKQAGGIPSLH